MTRWQFHIGGGGGWYVGRLENVVIRKSDVLFVFFFPLSAIVQRSQIHTNHLSHMSITRHVRVHHRRVHHRVGGQNETFERKKPICHRQPIVL